MLTTIKTFVRENLARIREKRAGTDYEKKREALLLFTATNAEKERIVRTMTKEQARKVIESLDATPDDDRMARAAIARVFPSLR